MRSLTHPDDLAALEELFAMAPGEQATAEVRFRHRDGHTVWTQQWARMRAHADGGRVLEGNAHDVTALRTSEAERATLEERFRLLAENSSDFLILVDAEGRLEWVSPSVTRVLGWRPANVEGQDTLAFAHPDDAASIRRAQESANAGQAVTRRLRVRRFDGSYGWFTATLTPVFDEDGAYRGRVSSFQSADDAVLAERALAQSERRYRLLAENSSDVVMHTRNNVVEWVSPSLTRMLGWAPEEWIGHSMAEFGYADDMPVIQSARDEMAAGASVVIRVRIADRARDYHWLELHGRQYLDENGEPDGILSSFRTIDSQIRAEQALEHRAMYDDLTGAFKRDEAIRRLDDLGAHRRTPGADCGVLFIDIDHFKMVNDTHGHVIGDRLLAALVGRVRAAVRSDDVISRVGGDEVLTILNGIHTLGEVEAIAEKIRIAINTPFDIDGTQVSASVCIGVTVSTTVEGADAIIRRADEAMYAAKEAGRNRIAVR